MIIVLFVISVSIAFVLGLIGGAYFMKLKWMQADPQLFMTMGKSKTDAKIGRIVSKPRGKAEFLESGSDEEVKRREKGWGKFDEEIEPSARAREQEQI